MEMNLTETDIIHSNIEPLGDIEFTEDLYE
jgi:hypothetical protein